MNSRDGSADELCIEAARRFVVHAISVIFDGHCFVLLLDSHLLDTVLAHEFEKRAVSEHLGNFQLMLVPML